MKKQAIGFTLTAKCISNENYKADFVVGDSYRARIAQFGALSVIGLDNESYIYPAEMFEVRDADGNLMTQGNDGTWTISMKG